MSRMSVVVGLLWICILLALVACAKVERPTALTPGPDELPTPTPASTVIQGTPGPSGRSTLAPTVGTQATATAIANSVPLSADDSERLFFAGQDHFAQERWEKAVTKFTEVLSVDPQNTLAFYYRGRAHRSLERHSLAVADFGDALRLELSQAYYYRARSHSATSDRARRPTSAGL